MKTFTCAICFKVFPDALKDEHHKIPQSLGGTDTPDNLVSLCKGDHQSLHSVAYMLVNTQRNAEIEPTLLALYPNDINSRKRLLEYANYVAKEMFLKKEIKKDATEEIRTIVELPQLYVQLLRLAGYDAPRANGRPLGVGFLIRLVVADYLSRKFSMRREEIMQLRNSKSKK